MISSGAGWWDFVEYNGGVSAGGGTALSYRDALAITIPETTDKLSFFGVHHNFDEIEISLDQGQTWYVYDDDNPFSEPPEDTPYKTTVTLPSTVLQGDAVWIRGVYGEYWLIQVCAD